MKVLNLFIVMFFFCNLNAQVVSIYDYSILDSNPGKYLKDINNDFTPFLGSWVWTQGDQKVTITFKKITQRYFSECDCHADFMVADYMYTTNYDSVTLVNTSLITQNSTDPAVYPMFCSYPIGNILHMSYKDFAITKNFKGSRAIFTRLPSNPNQMTMLLKNPEMTATVIGQPAFNPDFILPNNITVTKQ